MDLMIDLFFGWIPELVAAATGRESGWLGCTVLVTIMAAVAAAFVWFIWF